MPSSKPPPKTKTKALNGDGDQNNGSTAVKKTVSKSNAKENRVNSPDTEQKSEKFEERTSDKNMDSSRSSKVESETHNQSDGHQNGQSGSGENLDNDDYVVSEEENHTGSRRYENGHGEDVDRLSLTDSILSDTDEADNMYAYDAFYSGQDLANAELSSRQAKIIREILDNFVLEDVMDRYRGQSVMHSLEKKRQLLEDIMGKETIPYSDKQWHETIRQKVLEDLERQQDERERRLAEAETQRLIKLKLQGILRDEEETKTTERDTKILSPAEKRFEKRVVKKHESLYKPNDIQTQMEILNKSGNKPRSRERQKENDPDNDVPDDSSEINNSHSHDDKTDTDMPTYRSHLGRMKSDNTTVVHPDLERLYQEEDLDQLYKEAEHLVRVKPTHK